MFNAIAIMDFGKALGYTKMHEVQKIIGSFGKINEKNIEFETIDNLAKLIFYAIQEGCDVNNKEFDLTEKQIKRSFLNSPDSIVNALGEGMADAEEVEVGEQQAVKEKI